MVCKEVRVNSTQDKNKSKPKQIPLSVLLWCKTINLVKSMGFTAPSFKSLAELNSVSTWCHSCNDVLKSRYFKRHYVKCTKWPIVLPTGSRPTGNIIITAESSQLMLEKARKKQF